MPVVELRQYTLHPGRRDELIALFEREFVEGQEAAGMILIGQFRDLDDPDRFVWLRAFDDMGVRKRALEAFYGGPVWQAHRNAANATMIDSDDVLLLRPERDFVLDERGSREVAGRPGVGVVVCAVHRLSGSEDPLVGRFRADLAPEFAAAGLDPVAVLVTGASANTFPALPVREGERVLVWFAVAPDIETVDAALHRARADPALATLFERPLQMMRLQPTARSRLHG